MSTLPRSILVFRNGAIGNTLAAIPALRALRDRYPAAALAVVVDPVGCELLEHCPWIDRLIVYDKRGQDRGILNYIRIVRALRKTAPSHAVLFKRFFRNGLLAYLSGARVRAGFVTDGKAPFLNRTIPYDATIPVAELNLRLAALLGANPIEVRLEFFFDDSDNVRAATVLAELGVAENKLCVAHYGGLTTAPGFLPIDRFAALLQQLAPADTRIVLIGHGAQERAWRDAIVRQMPVCIAADDLPVRLTAALIQRARLFIGFNSGPTHIAAAVGTPALVLFRPDARVHDEIRKWLPVSPVARPLIPPAAQDEQAWAEFFAAARRAAEEIVSNPAPQ